MLADFCKNLLHDDELIRHKREIHGKFSGTRITFNIQNGVCETKQITENGVVLLINCFQFGLGFIVLFQNTLLNHFVHRGRRKAQTGFETSLNSGELISTNLDDLVNGFLSGADNPHLTAAFAADFLNEGLEIQKHIGICSDILTHFVHHKQQTEVVWFGGQVILNILYKLGDGKLSSRFIIEPSLGIFLTHVQYFHQSRNDKFAVKGKGFTGINPRHPFLFFKDTMELLGLSLLVNVLFQLDDLQILAKETQMIIEGLSKHTQNSSFVLIDRTLNINIEQNRLCLHFCRTVNQHISCRVILKFLAESFNAMNAFYLFILQKIGQHFQEVRFTTSKETGNPYTGIGCRLIQRITIIIEKGNEVLLQFLCNHILI